MIGSGRLRSVEQLLDTAFAHVGLDWHDHVVVRERRDEPALRADPRRIMAELGWQPSRSFETLIGDMVDADLRIAMSGQHS